MTTALVVVDVQNDFTTGSLAVAGGPQAAVNIANFIEANDNHADPTKPLQYDFKVATKDWHIDPGTHWAAPGEAPDFVDSWPVHCEVGTDGADFDPALEGIRFDAVFKKGEYEACYSGFEGTAAIPAPRLSDSNMFAGRAVDIMSLDGYLRNKGVTDLIICGIATDYCVKATVLDALRLGYKVTVPLTMCAAVTPETGAAAVEEMRAAGAIIV